MFAEPDWSSPIDFAARLAAIPRYASARGMFFQIAIAAMGPEVLSHLGGRRYVAFKNYPMREYVELLELGCNLNAARIAPAMYLRELGHGVYSGYARTVTGTAIFAMAGRNFRRVIELCPAAYSVTTENSKINIVSISNTHAICELREVWNLPDLHHVGVWEGAMQACGVAGRILIERHGLGSVDFDVSWTQPDS